MADVTAAPVPTPATSVPTGVTPLGSGGPLGNRSEIESGGTITDGIITPEAVVLDVRTAGFAPRILAGLIDLIVMAALMLFVSLLVLFISAGDGSTVTTIVSIATFAVLFAYPIGFETLWRGRTPGKAALGVRAVNVDGSPVRLKDATLRAMGGVVDRLLPPGGITGALFVTLTPRHQRVGDLIAGTIVVRDPDKYVVSPALWFTAPPGLEGFAESIDPTAVTVEQYTVVRSFLTRANSFPPDVRAAIARDLATRLAVTIRHPGSTAIGPEVFLICVMARYQRRNGPGVARGTVPAPVLSPGVPIPVHGPAGAANVSGVAGSSSGSGAAGVAGPAGWSR